MANHLQKILSFLLLLTSNSLSCLLLLWDLLFIPSVMAATTGIQFSLMEISEGINIKHLGFYPISDVISTVATGESHNLSGILASVLCDVENTVNFI